MSTEKPSKTKTTRKRTKKSKIIADTNEWTFEHLEAYDKAIAAHADKFQLDTFPNQIEVIGAEQMMDAYASVGMPLGYAHWSFGKQFLNVEKNYKRGNMGLAYELVINSNPCIAYLLEENTLTMQALVIAHACYGHNSFFKSNYLFQTWTSPDSIIDYLVFAKNYVSKCEERHGIDAVEEILDSCHAIMDNGVDRYQRPPKLSLIEEKARQKKRAEYLQSQVNDLWRTIPKSEGSDDPKKNWDRFPKEPQENILYFLEKNAPLLEPWQREIIRIVRKIAQYFYPQRQTKVMNEGWASFWHYTLINALYDAGQVTDQFMLEFLPNHTNVIYQPPYNSPYFNGLNPYTLGFAMFQDIRRICEAPTDEDKKWFPDFAGSNWIETLQFAMRNFKDESFIAQFLSPKVIRDLKLFAVRDDDKEEELLISAIHDEPGYQEIRQLLSNSYNLGNQVPDIQVYSVDRRGDRALTLRYTERNRQPLDNQTDEVLRHIHRLWGFDVKLETLKENGDVVPTGQCPQPEPTDQNASTETS